MFDFIYERFSSQHRGRLGVLKTPHGTIQTPAFIFCATKASIKGMPMEVMKTLGTQIVLSNTYHLMLQPGAQIVQEAGGLHKFCGWTGPMLTDSGGFQIFSLGHGSVADEIKGRRKSGWEKSTLKLDETGAIFRSYVNGAKYLLTPEKSIDVQRKLGADFIVVLDECTPFHTTKEYTAASMERSHRWGKRCLKEFEKQDHGSQKLYGIIQGGIYEDLRTQSIDFVNSMPFFGHAIGGSLGGNKKQMFDIVEYSTPLLSPDRPIHLLGIGGIEDIFHGVAQGIDTFDCVHPTRIARHGGALCKGIPKNYINLRNARHIKDNDPISKSCKCSTCQKYSKGYIHHLLKAKELLAYYLVTVHNVYVMNMLLEDIRLALRQDTLENLKKQWVV